MCNRGGQKLSHAIIAPVVHVKLVFCNEGIEWNAGDLVPITHNLTAPKDIDSEFFPDVGKKADQFGEIRFGNDLGRELRIDQHNISLDYPKSVDALAHQRPKDSQGLVLQQPIGTELPDDNIRIV